MTHFLFFSVRALLALSLILSVQLARAVIRDGGVDPANLGKGDQIYVLSYATNKLGGQIPSVTSTAGLMQFYTNQGIRFIVVKAGDGNQLYYGTYGHPQFTSALVNTAHAYGLFIFGYNYSVGSDIPGEVAIADYVFNTGADGFVYDAETEWESSVIGSQGPTLAWQLCSTVRAHWPNKFQAYSSYPIISYHSSFPYKEFGYWCDTSMPQIYPQQWDGVHSRPSGGINWTDVNWRNWQNSLKGTSSVINGQTIYWTNAIKPLAPVNHVYASGIGGITATPSTFVMEFLDYLNADPHAVTAGGYQGASFWRADLHNSTQWGNIKASTIGTFPGIVNNIVLDNPQATTVGAWTATRTFYNGTFYGNGSGTDFDSFGTNYATHTQGPGGAYINYTPRIVVPGDYDLYECHVTRSDASTATPFQIYYDGGSTTVSANQSVNPGKWCLLGRYFFAAGTAGTIRVLDSFPDAGKVAIADGLKLVFVPPSATPTAPSGLSATPVSYSQINLAWSDNANNESAYVVARSTVSGGPYTDIASLGRNTTSYSNTGLAAVTAYYYVVRATNYLGASANSAPASAVTLIPPTPPSITTQPLSQTASAGSNVTFTVVAAGSVPFSYQWRKESVSLAGATASALVVATAQASDQGQYSVVVSNAYGGVISSAAQLTVLNAGPWILTQPQDQTVVGGSNVTFSVLAVGTLPLGYQWRLNGTNLAGATQSAFTRNNVVPADAGSYSALVSNQFGLLTSSSAVLTVVSLPQITTQPQSQAVTAGSNATFMVAATGAVPLACQWRRDGANITGATATSYTRTNVQSADIGLYSAVVSNPYGSLASADAALTLDGVIVFHDDFESVSLTNWSVAPNASTLVLATVRHSTNGGVNSAWLDLSTDKMYHSLGLTLENRARATFWAYDDTASSANTNQTRWFGELRSYSGGSYGNGSLVQMFAIGRYGVGFGSPTGSLSSEVVNPASYQGRVLAGPNSGWFNLNVPRSIGWHKFMLERAANGTTINFYVDGALARSIPDATAATWDSLTIGSVGSGTAVSGNVWFDDVRLEYLDPPTITAQPGGLTVAAGAPAAFSVAVANNPRSYQWRLNGVNLGNGGNISGATSATLSLASAQGVDAGDYTVVIANGIGPVTSTTATLKVAPSITSQPTSITNAAGSTAIFTVVAAGQGPLSYQWKKGGVPLADGGNLSGAASPTLTLTGVLQSDAGSYCVTVTNAAGSVSSSPTVTLTVIDPPTITVQPQDQALVAGASLLLTATATGASPLRYQWRLNGSDIAGATASALGRTNVHSADAGSYAVVVANGGGSVTSRVVVVTVNNPPVLDSINSLTVHAGTLVAVPNAAADPDADQVLTFSLDPGAPAAATMSAGDGLLTWPTSDAQANTTNIFTVRVTDNGVPSLSDAGSFTIAVLGRPLVLSAVLATNLLNLTWSAIAGQTYRLQYKLNLEAADWTELLDVVAPGPTASASDASTSDAGPVPRRYYRILVVE